MNKEPGQACSTDKRASAPPFAGAVPCAAPSPRRAAGYAHKNQKAEFRRESPSRVARVAKCGAQGADSPARSSAIPVLAEPEGPFGFDSARLAEETRFASGCP